MVQGSAGGAAELRLRRFATQSFPIGAGEVAAKPVAITIPADRSDVPWQLQVSGSGPVARLLNQRERREPQDDLCLRGVGERRAGGAGRRDAAPGAAPRSIPRLATPRGACDARAAARRRPGRRRPTPSSIAPTRAGTGRGSGRFSGLGDALLRRLRGRLAGRLDEIAPAGPGARRRLG